MKMTRKLHSKAMITMICTVLLTMGGLLSGTAWAETNPANQSRTTLQNPVIEADASLTAGQKVTWDTLYYGYYPQTEIVGDSQQCGTIKNKVWAKNTDYDIQPEIYEKLQKARYTKTGDTVIDGVKYRRLAKADCTYLAPTQEIQIHYFWNSKYPYHYFRYEPIRWRVLQISGENALLLADQVLDDQQYNSTQTDITWEKSTLRRWMNHKDLGDSVKTSGFMATAFRPNENEVIVTTEVPNDDNYAHETSGGATTHDQMFLLSENELYGTRAAQQYGFVSAYDRGLAQARDTEDEARRATRSSTYAKAMGLFCNNEPGFEGNNMWWMRTPGQFSRYATFVCKRGFIRYHGGMVTNGDVGVRPSMILNLDQANWTYAGTVASDGTETETSAPAQDIFTKEEIGLTEEPTQPSQPTTTKVTSIKLSATPSGNIAAGKKVTVKAAVSPSNASDKAVIWSTSNKKYATVSSKGVVKTLAKGKGKTVTITAIAKDGSGKKGAIKIRIRKHRVKKITLKAPKSIRRGKSGKVKATVRTTGKDAYKSLRYTSSNSRVKVSTSGKVTVAKSAKKGTVRVTVTSRDGTGIRKTAKIRIR